jgi:Ferritin-like domain
MSLDEQGLHELLEESEDLHADAMRVHAATMPDLADHASDTRHDDIDPNAATRLDASRRELVSELGIADHGLLKKGAVVGGVGAMLAALLAGPAAADKKLDVQILQTASSLEVLAVATYGAALTLPFIKNGNAVVKKFAQTTRMQHDEHRQAFQAQTKTLGGKKQTKPNPKYASIVTQMKPSLKTPADVVTLAATLETVATETYLSDLGQLSDRTSKELFASVMGVECQHLATLRAVGALLAGGADNLIAIPTDAAALPAAAGSVAFPAAFEPVTMASPPQEGAVK